MSRFRLWPLLHPGSVGGPAWRLYATGRPGRTGDGRQTPSRADEDVGSPFGCGALPTTEPVAANDCPADVASPFPRSTSTLVPIPRPDTDRYPLAALAVYLTAGEGLTLPQGATG